MNEIKKVDFDTKDKFYNYLNIKLMGLVSSEEDVLANLSNASAFFNLLLDNINWVGFYLYKNDELVLGPFQGKPACTHIEMGKGVCGTTAKSLETQLVPDVHEFPGHIACDSASQSEIVIPLVQNGKLVGVLDIDSPIKNRFDEEDQIGLEKAVETLNKYVNISQIL
ncbi:GAF domain-containing protein [Anaeromicrobium sediminis]|uniref:Guanylate cyclase n=1 Tax=Anaeromicrobium sediminis TaxID=1478221 RepID=A0A267MK28_9FIRM|nr:GAF domain-containing protein [Anaeromicrobium sediminis]PAB59934.1 guanylate cyclase [Anaeromicrobium sediminis]